MTLIVGCITDEHAIQVSDRYITLTDKNANTHEVLETDRNKCIFAAGLLSIGYSGNAYVGAERTDVWLAKLVSRFESSETHPTLIDWLGGASQALLAPLDAKFAIVGLGWIPIAETSGFQKGCLIVSNQVDARNGAWLKNMRHEFMQWQQVVRPGGVFFHPPIGAAVKKELWNRTKDSIHRAIRGGAGPCAAIDRLVKLVREVSDRQAKAGENVTVGKDVLVTVFPRPGHIFPPTNRIELCTPMTPQADGENADDDNADDDNADDSDDVE